MVLLLPKVTSFGEEFGQKIGSGFSEGFFEGIEKGKTEKKQKQISSEQMSYLEDLGIDPRILQMPEDVQKEYFKGAFSKEKQLTPLQESQKALADERLNALKDRQNYFNRLTGNQQREEFGTPQIESPNVAPNTLSEMSEDNLTQLAAFAGQPGEEGIIGNIAQAELTKKKEEKKANIEKKEREEKKFESERAYHTQFSKEQEKEAEQLRSTIPKKEMALDFARNAVETGNTSYFSPDKLADVTGIDLFRTAKGAQLVTAGKENLLGNMGRVSSRAQNMWFEQRLNSMFPNIGQSKEANLTVQEMLEGELALDKAYTEEFDRIANEDQDKYGFVKKDASKRAHNNIKSLEKEILRRTTYRMKEIEEVEKGLTVLKKEIGKNVVKGTPLTMAMARLYKDKYGAENALTIAKKNGYYIPTIEEFQIFQQRPEEFREGIVE